MEWIDIILDHVSKYKIENISKIERKYLDQYDTDNSKNLEDVLIERVKYYEKAIVYDIKNSFFYDEEIWGDLTEDQVNEARLNILWEIVLDDDFETYRKIYEIPYMVLSYDWVGLPKIYQDRFKDYWKSYYNFNI